MRSLLALVAAALAAAPAFGQVRDSALGQQQDQLFMQAEAQRQRALELERQSFAAQQRAATDQALQTLQAQRNGAAPPIVQPAPDVPAAYAASAHDLRRLQDEAAAAAATATVHRHRPR